MSHIHGPIVPTPDSKPGATRDELYRDNIAYMDKLVGKLVTELDRLHLRDKTLIVFTGDNGTAPFGVDGATVNGRRISGQKATMLEGGSRVPLIVNWPGIAPAGAVNHDLIDFSDFFATFASLANAPLPEGVTLDSHSFVPQIKGQPGTPREWVYIELNGRAYVRDSRFKLTKRGDLYDLSEAPYKESLVASNTTDGAALSARSRLQAVLNQLPTAPGKGNNPGQAARRKDRKQAN